MPKAVLGDKFRLEHMLTNIVSNAIKMSAEGGTVTISVTTLNAHTAEHRKLVDNIREGDSDDDQFELSEARNELKELQSRYRGQCWVFLMAVTL